MLLHEALLQPLRGLDEGLTSLVVHPFIMSTTTTLKPRPTRKPRKQMTEQTNTNDSPVTITKVQSHRPDVQLIDRHALWDDFQARMKINNYEVGEAFKDLKSVINATKKVGGQLRDKYDEFTQVKQ